MAPTVIGRNGRDLYRLARRQAAPTSDYQPVVFQPQLQATGSFQPGLAGPRW